MLAAMQKYGSADVALDSIAQAGFSSVMNMQARARPASRRSTPSRSWRRSRTARRTRTSSPTTTRATASRCRASASVCNGYQKMKQVKGGKVTTVDDQWISGTEHFTPPPRSSPPRRVLVSPLPRPRPGRGRRLRHTRPRPGAQAPQRRRGRLRARRGGDVHRLCLPGAARRRDAAVPVGDPAARARPGVAVRDGPGDPGLARLRGGAGHRHVLADLPAAAARHRPDAGVRVGRHDARAAGDRRPQLRHDAEVDADDPALGAAPHRRPHGAVRPPVVRRHRARARRVAGGRRTASRASAWPRGRWRRTSRARRSSGSRPTASAPATGSSPRSSRASPASSSRRSRPSTRRPTRCSSSPRSASRWSRASTRSRSRRLAGLVLGMFQSEITKLLTVWDWLPERGVPQALPFIVIMIAMTLLSRGVGARGTVGELHNPSLGRPTRPYADDGDVLRGRPDRAVGAAGLAARRVHLLAGLRLPRAVAHGAHRLRRAGLARADVVRRASRRSRSTTSRWARGCRSRSRCCSPRWPRSRSGC